MRSLSAHRFRRYNTTLRVPTHRNFVSINQVDDDTSEWTHDHKIERDQDDALGPICLGVGRDVVDEEGRPDEQDDFE
jgi:hypothetical protein